MILCFTYICNIGGASCHDRCAGTATGHVDSKEDDHSADREHHTCPAIHMSGPILICSDFRRDHPQHHSPPRDTHSTTTCGTTPTHHPDWHKFFNETLSKTRSNSKVKRKCFQRNGKKGNTPKREGSPQPLPSTHAPTSPNNPPNKPKTKGKGKREKGVGQGSTRMYILHSCQPSHTRSFVGGNISSHLRRVPRLAVTLDMCYTGSSHSSLFPPNRPTSPKLLAISV